MTAGAAEGPALPRRGPGRPRGPVRHRVRVRPLPARQQRRQPASRSTRSATSAGALRDEAARAGPPAAPVGRPRRAGGGPAGARRRHRQGRLRGDGRQQRRGARRSARAPSFDPNIFSKGIKQRDLDRLNDEDNGAPLINRAIQGGYPTGSTFKLITATAGARGRPDHARTRRSTTRGSLTVGGVTFKNAGGAVARRARAAPGAHGLERRVLLPARPAQANGSGDGLCSSAGRAGSASAATTGIDLPGRAARAAARRPSGATSSSRTKLTRTGPGASATT